MLGHLLQPLERAGRKAAIPCRLAGDATERVSGVAANPGDWIVERSGDHVDGADVVDVIEELDAPPPPAWVGIAHPRCERGEDGVGERHVLELPCVRPTHEPADRLQRPISAQLLHPLLRLHPVTVRSAHPPDRPDFLRTKEAGRLADDVCSYIVKRTQIYVDEEQDSRLARRAAQLGVTKSELIRTAVDEFLDHDDEHVRLAAFREAVLRSVGRAPSLPAGDQYVEDMRQADARRLASLSED